uniref:Uncharacterized protein n=1 Tax=Anguilla anguilla TaxID=7936 RepID=A0A0E9VWX0_ANGAN
MNPANKCWLSNVICPGLTFIKQLLSNVLSNERCSAS